MYSEVAKVEKKKKKKKRKLVKIIKFSCHRSAIVTGRQDTGGAVWCLPRTDHERTTCGPQLLVRRPRK